MPVIRYPMILNETTMPIPVRPDEAVASLVRARGPQNRRHEPRYDTDETARYYADEDRQGQGRVLDVSRSGIRIRVPIQLTAGSTLTVEFSGCKFTGEVRHCHNVAGGGFDVGVLLNGEAQG